MIKKESFQFLKDLAKNNNREWFKSNDPYYRTALNDIKTFQKDLTAEMNKMDQIEKSKLFRIYRDVRFSKDKTPYNKHFSMSFSREGKHRRGGYYLKITPGDSMTLIRPTSN